MHPFASLLLGLFTHPVLIEPKSLTPVNLIRLGLAYPTTGGVIKRPVYKTNFHMMDDHSLKTWYKEIVALLKHSPHGPYTLAMKIFGQEVTDRLTDLGHFPNRRGVAQAAPVRSILTSTASSRTSRTSSKRTIVDVDEDENSWPADDSDAGEFAPLPHRRRLA